MRATPLASLVMLCSAAAWPLGAQLPLTPITASGKSVTPVFEGWYRNPDSTFSISFGYFNRNSEEVLEIPIGPNNYLEPGPQNQGQPTRFEPRRHWGVFAVKVPADFADKKLVWTLKVRGETFAIPASLHPNWQIDALEGEVGSGNTPPVLRFEPNGNDGSGPLGVTAGPLAVAVGAPLEITVWVKDDGKSSGTVGSDGRAGAPVTLTWFKHQGPAGGNVTFSQATARVAPAEGKMTTTVTFGAPGRYILRVRANDASGVANAGHAQCCWTNGFVKVTVAR